MSRVAKDDLNVDLGPPGSYAVGNVFFEQQHTEGVKKEFEAELVRRQLLPLGWRKLPVDDSSLGASAKASQPHIEQIFVGRPEGMSQDEFERRLFLSRRLASNTNNPDSNKLMPNIYVCSLSSKTIVYKGMLLSVQLDYYPDLSEPDFASHMGMVHSRFSTNTFPNWSLAQVEDSIFGVHH